MLRKLTSGLLATAVMGFAGTAMAASSSSNVNVNISILATVSLWGDEASLTLDGSNSPDNSNAVASQLHYINNVDSNVSASVAGLPAASPGQGIQFHIFNGTSDTGAAIAAINANQYGPAGAITFNSANQASPQTLIASTGVNTTIHNQDIVYAAGLPGDLPTPGNFTAVVTYTITSN
jgi:hypothetical protein